MPIYESEGLTHDQLEFRSKTWKCQCGGDLLVAWGGSTGHHCYMLRCGNSLEHSEFVRPFKVSNYDQTGFNMPGIIRRRTQMMMQKYGEEKTKQIVKIGGGNPIATLTQKGAATMLEVLYPEATANKSGQAAIVKAALICRDYGLNPAMGHVRLIKYGDKIEVVMEIKATRIIAGKNRKYGYIDDTPRVMTEDEQIKIFGEIDKANLCTICKIKDEFGNTFTGYGTWSRNKEPYGADKGNSKFNMSSIRGERQALLKMDPGSMPADVDVIDERYTEPGQVVVSEIKGDAKQIEGTGQVGDQQSGDNSNANSLPRDPATIKNLGDLFTACTKDWPEKFAVKADVLQFIGKKENEIADASLEYTLIASKMFQVKQVV